MALVIGVGADVHAQGLGKLISPGDLSSLHEEIEGITNCAKCHAFTGGLPDSKCLECHEDIKSRIASKRGYHSTVTGKRCFKCHSDHKGLKFSMIEWNKEKFDHGKKNTGYKLDGKHSKAKCEDCHKGKTKKGQPSFLLADSRCVTCHKKDDVHKGSLGDKCETCHNAYGWKGKYVKFDHDKVYKLEKGHAKVKCADCHKIKGRYKEPGFEKCVTCHKKDDVHKGSLGDKCETCHNATSWKGKYVKFDHDKVYKLEKGHAKVKCADCHKIKGRYKEPGFEKCVTCHKKDDIHKGTLGDKCETCHNTSGWKGRYVKFDHSRTKYRLEGKHRKAKCETCHPRAKKGVYKVAKYDTCDTSGCHDARRGGAVHGKQFAGRKCDQCHTVAGWKPTLFKHEDKRYKGFKLLGLHNKVKCADCHKPDFKREVKYRPIDYARCDSSGCHDTKKRGDIHGKQFADQLCASCHSESGWKPTLFKHESTRYKGYKLKGKHAKVKCADCHKKSLFGRVAYKPINTKSCASSNCHNDPHKGTLKDKKCDRCHTEQDWKKLAFDHNRDSSFDLDGKHVKAKCEKCHVGKVWKPVKSRCYDCHAKEDKHKGTLGKKCDDCHNAQSWKTDKFAHQATGFRLEGVHKQQKCKDCHKSKDMSLPPGEDCIQCHVDPHLTQFGSLCSDCHSAFSWEPLKFRHSETGFRLEGAHRSTECQNCHKNRDYRNTAVDCYSCHKSDFFGATATGIHSPSNTECQDCHKQYGWTPASGYSHTSMTFSGSHASIQGSCSLCHTGTSYQLLYPATSESDCSACHQADYYKEHANGSPAASPCPQACALCHNTTTFGDAQEIVTCD